MYGALAVSPGHEEAVSFFGVMDEQDRLKAVGMKPHQGKRRRSQGGLLVPRQIRLCWGLNADQGLSLGSNSLTGPASRTKVADIPMDANRQADSPG